MNNIKLRGDQRFERALIAFEVAGWVAIGLAGLMFILPFPLNIITVVSFSIITEKWLWWVGHSHSLIGHGKLKMKLSAD